MSDDDDKNTLTIGDAVGEFDHSDEAARRAAKTEYHRLYNRQRYAQDPEYRERKLRRNRELYRRRAESDPSFLEKKREANRLAMERRKKKLRTAPKAPPAPRHHLKQINNRVAKKIRDTRLLRGVTIRSAAEALDVQRRQFYMYESGLTSITSSVIWRMSNLLDISIDWLFSEDAPQPAPRKEKHRLIPDDADDFEELINAYFNIKSDRAREAALKMMLMLGTQDSG